MSIEYAEMRIKEALDLARGNAVQARKQVVIWAFEDPKLLQALTKHHLTGIVAYHLERVISGRSAQLTNGAPSSVKSSPSPSPSVPKPKLKPKAQPAADSFGKEILKAVVNSNSAVFGLEGGYPPPKPKPASQQHVNAIRQMAREIKSKHRE